MSAKIYYYNGKAVIHFLSALTESDHEQCEQLAENNGDIFSVNTKYAYALSKAKKFGGRKFHNKKFGGGIAFESDQELKDFLKTVNQ